MEPVTTKGSAILDNIETGRTRQNTDTLGGFLDSCKDETPILLYFDGNDGIQRIPNLLGDPPTVSQLRDNAYLRPLKIRERTRYQIAGTSETDWSIRIGQRFNRKKYRSANA